MLRELRLLRPYLFRYRWHFAGGFACVVATLALKVLIPAWLGGAIDELRRLAEDSGDGAADPDRVRSLVTGAAVSIVLVAALAGAVRTTSRLLILGVSRRAVHDVRRDLFEHLTSLSPSFYARTPTGHLMSRCINDVQNVQGLLGPVSMYTVETLVLYVVALTMMARIDAGLTTLGILPFPLFIYYARRHAMVIHRTSREAQAKLGEVSAKVDESFSGQHVIKTLTLEDHDRDRFEQQCDEYRGLNLAVTRARARILPAMIVLGSLCIVIVLAVGGPRVMRGELTLGRLVQMMIYLQMMAHPTGTLGFVISSFQRGAAALGRLREVLEMPPALVDPEEPVADPVRRGEVEVRELTVVHDAADDVPHLSGMVPDGRTSGGNANNGNDFGDGQARRVVLDRVSLHVPPGSTLGVTGPTGAGKTTLLAAIGRQLEVEPGTIFLDGTDVTRARLDDVRRRIGCVPQESFLFSATLAENIAWGRPEASRRQVEEAAERSRLAADLDQLPDGLDTLLGERGVNLSGGQRQRAALARVMVQEPTVLLLDDTLSAVDTHTADEILAHLRPLMAGRTTILVAHRLTTLQHADEILYLEGGRVVERGTHAELMAAGGRYARTYEDQALRSALQHELDDGLEDGRGEPPGEDRR